MLHNKIDSLKIQKMYVYSVYLSPPIKVREKFFFNKTLTFMHNLLRKSATFKIRAQKVLTLVYFNIVYLY